MSDSCSLENLVFVRLLTSQHVPKYLLEQVKHLGCPVEKWYDYQEMTLIQHGPDGKPLLNPLSMLYALRDDDYVVKGVLWCSVNVLENMLCVDLFSIDKDYWHKSQAMNIAADYVKEIVDECNLDGAYWLTRSPKHSEKCGFKRSKRVLMEVRREEHGRQSETGGHEHQSTAESAGVT